MFTKNGNANFIENKLENNKRECAPISYLFKVYSLRLLFIWRAVIIIIRNYCGSGWQGWFLNSII